MSAAPCTIEGVKSDRTEAAIPVVSRLQHGPLQSAGHPTLDREGALTPTSFHDLRHLPSKYGAPSSQWRHVPPWPCVASALTNPSLVLAADADFVSLGRLAAAVALRGTPTLWIRLDAADTDPDVFLFTLVEAVASFDADTSSRLHSAVKGHIARGEWDSACLAIADGIHIAAAGPATVVIEGADLQDPPSFSGVRRVLSSLLSGRCDDTTFVLVASADWNHSSGANGVVLRADDLLVDVADACCVAAALGCPLPYGSLCRLVELTNGGAGAIEAILAAGGMLGADRLEALIARARDRTGLLDEVGTELRCRSGTGTLNALAAASHLGRWHSTLAGSVGPDPALRSSPWWLDLADGWLQLLPVWRRWLQRDPDGSTGSTAGLADVADRLLADRAALPAVELYAAAGRMDRAIETAALVAGELVKCQRWRTLEHLRSMLSRDPAHRTLDRCDVAPQAGNADRCPASLPDDPCHELSGPALRTFRPGLELGPPGVHETRQHPPECVPGTPPILTVHLLGPTRASLDDRPIQCWVSGRGRAIFEYLVVNRHNATPRERLMSIFWPDASPDGARNSLNVAIHGLRQSFRTAAGEQPIVIHRNRSYLIQPGLEVWLDVDAFEQRLKSAQQHLVSHELGDAENDFEAAIGLYQGEFLADDPYEEWAIVTREHLRLAYLDALDQLGSLRFDSGNYGGAAELCLKMLAYDNCREDAHCRLMRCYSRRGQPQLALRQYHACLAILRSELRMEPAATTTDLFQRIQRRDEV